MAARLHAQVTQRQRPMPPLWAVWGQLVLVGWLGALAGPMASSALLERVALSVPLLRVALHAQVAPRLLHARRVPVASLPLLLPRLASAPLANLGALRRVRLVA